MADRDIAVALSGGGHRASAFACGAMLYLGAAGKTAEVRSVASVSGGSLTNGAIAQDVDLATCTQQELEQAVGRVAGRLTGAGTLFGAPVTWAYLAGLVAAVAATAAGAWLLDGVWWKLLACGAGALLLGWLLALRGRVCARAFAKTLFRSGWRPTRLADVHTGVDHVICATDLHAGEHVYFSGRFVYAYRFGLGSPGRIGLHRVVQASAAFPGAFPVAWMRTAPFSFNSLGRARSLALHDGGVYDNMADQWAHGLQRRNERGPSGFRNADELIVVNASAGRAWGSVWRMRLPWLGELFTLLRDKSVLYDNGNSVRRRELVSRFDLAEREGQGLRGALVHIPQNPFTIPGYFAERAEMWPERAERALAAQAHLLDGSANPGAAHDEWDRVARANAAVPTTLAGLPSSVVARLMRHAYVLAMANLHVILGYPLLPIPPMEYFHDLTTGRRSPGD